MPGNGKRRDQTMQKKNYVQEILDIIHSGLPQAELAEKLSDYHENDLADALAALTPGRAPEALCRSGRGYRGRDLLLSGRRRTLPERTGPARRPPASFPTWTRTMPWTLWTTWKKTIRPRSSASWTRTAADDVKLLLSYQRGRDRQQHDHQLHLHPEGHDHPAGHE